MAKVLVLQVPDDYDLSEAMRLIDEALGGLPHPIVAFAAIAEDADRVLRVFEVPG